MDSPRSLSEQRHDQAVGVVCPWELHVVRELIWRDSVKNKLSRVCILSLVAFEWDAGNAQTYEGHEHQCGKNDEQREMP